MELQNNYRTYNISLIPMESQFICLQEMLPFMLDIKLTSVLVFVLCHCPYACPYAVVPKCLCKIFVLLLYRSLPATSVSNI